MRGIRHLVLAGVLSSSAVAGATEDAPEAAPLAGPGAESASPVAGDDPATTAPLATEPETGPEDDISALDLEALLDTPIAAASASRTEEKSSRAPANVFVMTSEDIRRFGFRSLDEVLRSVPGLFVSNDTFYPTVGVRGMNLLGDLSTRTLVLVDGHPMNNSVGIGQGYLGRDLPVDVTALERVEVIKGPVGSVYGPVAYYGVINLVTKKLGAPEVYAAGDYMQNQLRGGEARARASGMLGPVELNGFVGVFRSTGRDYAFPEFELSGDRDLPAEELLRGTGYESSQNAYATARWQDFSARFGWTHRIKGLPTAPYSSVIGDPLNRFTNRTGFGELTWSKQVIEPLQLHARLAYDDFRYGDDLAYPELPDDYGHFVDLGRDQWGTVEARGTLSPFKGHRDTVGVELQFHKTLQHSRYLALPSAVEDPENGFGVGPIASDHRTVNAYLSVEQTFFDSLTLQAGVTFFDHSLFGNRFTPKLSAVWQPTSEDTVKVLYAEGFRPPTMFEAFFTDGLDFLPNSLLRPETAVSRELIYERRLFGVASLTASIYRNSYHQLINAATVLAPDLEPDADLEDPTNYRAQYLNSGTIHATGADLGVTVRKGDWIQAYGGFSVQEGVFEGEFTSAAGFAPITANLAVSTRAFWQPLTLSFDASYVHNRAKDLANLLPGFAETTDPALRLNASARLDVPAVKGLTVMLSAYNLTDARLAMPVGGDHAPISEVPDIARTVRLGVNYRFE